MYHISYEDNGIYQAILVDAVSAEEAKRVFCEAKSSARVCGCEKARPDDMKPNKPILRTH